MPEDQTKLKRLENNKALSLLMLFKEKRDGQLKRRHCVDSLKQREYMLKEEAVSPAVATESVFTTAAISTWEKRFNRSSGKVAYIRPLKLQASLRAHDLVQKHELVDVGHRFGNVSVLATMPGNFYLRKLERTSNAD